LNLYDITASKLINKSYFITVWSSEMSKNESETAR